MEPNLQTKLVPHGGTVLKKVEFENRFIKDIVEDMNQRGLNDEEIHYNVKCLEEMERNYLQTLELQSLDET